MPESPCRLANPLLLSVIQEYVSILSLASTCRDCLVAAVPVIQLILTPDACAEFVTANGDSLASRAGRRVSSVANQLTLSALTLPLESLEGANFFLQYVKRIRSLTLVASEARHTSVCVQNFANVEELNLRGSRLMLEFFGTCDYMRRLSISTGKLSCTGADSVASCRHSFPATAGKFPRLQSLELKVEEFCSPLNSVIGQPCLSLENLCILTRRKIDIPELVELFPNLKSLELDDYVNKSDLSAVVKFGELAEFRSMVTRKLPVLPKLKTLKLTYYGEGRIAKQLVKKVADMEQLERLELVGFRATEFRPLRSLRNLKSLEIRSGLFGDMSFIQELESLEQTELDYLTEYAECDFDFE